MNISHKMISVVVAGLLAGCGGTGSGSGDSKSKVCADKNLNAVCDAGEMFKEVTTWDGNTQNNIEVDPSLKGAALAYNGANGYIFTAPADSDKINTGTTIIQNELIYNRIIENKTEDAVKNYIRSHFPGGQMSTDHKKAIADAIRSNIKDHSNKNRYAVIAAVMNKLFSQNQIPADIAGIRVTDADIHKADVPSLAKLEITEAFDVNLTKVKEDMKNNQPVWSEDSKDTSFRYLASKNGKVVAATYEHNGLAVIDTAGQTLVYSPASVLTDAGHGKLSPSADASSGASEPAVNSIALTSDGLTVYYNVPAKSDKSNKDIIGLFKATVKADGSMDLTEKSLPNGPGLVYYADTKLDMKVSKFALSNDDSKVIVYDADKNLLLYDANLENRLGATDDASVDALTAVAVSATNVYTAAAGSTKITKREAEGTLDPVGNIEIGFAADEMIINDDGMKMFAFTHGHDHGGVTSIALIDLATDAVINSGELTYTSDGAAISPDFTRAALFGHEEDRVDIVNLAVKGFSIQGKYDKSARSATFTGNDKLAVTDRKKVYILDIVTTTDNNTLAEEMALAKESINEKNINGGPLSVIIKDLNLPHSFGSIDIDWTSTLPTNILNIQTGKITRPANGTGDVTDKELVAKLKVQFRNTNLTDEVRFSGLTVRQMPKLIPASQMHSVASGRADYPAANADGSVMTGPIRDADDIYSMGSFKAEADGTVTIATAPFRFDPNETVRGAGIVGHYAIFTTSHKDENRSRIYSVAINSDGTLADHITDEVVNAIPTAQPQKMEWTSDNTRAAVILRDSKKKYHGAIYRVDTDGDITLEKTFPFGGISVANHGPMAVNDDASLAYQKDSKRKYVYAVNTSTGTIEANATNFPNSIARVWFAHGYLFEHDYEGNIVTLNPTTLEKLHTYHTGTGGRMYGGEGRTINGTNYYIVPVQQGGETVNGIYIFEVLSDGKLKEIAFANNPHGADRMAVSGDGKTVFYGFRDEKGNRHIGTVKITDNDL